jgi:hypothetical protein
MELQYNPSHSKKTDYSTSIFGKRWGVSVTRAMSWKKALTVECAARLAVKKLIGIHASTNSVLNDNWKRQILHVFCPSKWEASVFRKALNILPRDLTNNVIVIMTVGQQAIF